MEVGGERAPFLLFERGPRRCFWPEAGRPLRLEILTCGLDSFPSWWFVSLKSSTFPGELHGLAPGGNCPVPWITRLLGFGLMLFSYFQQECDLSWAGTQFALICILLSSWHGVFVNDGPFSEASLCLHQVL